jgi:hypothetical protein
MSNIITTTRDAGRETAIAAYFGVRRAGRVLAERAKDPTGQTAAEYMGVLFLVAMIIAAIVLLKVPQTIADGINGLVNNISTGTDPKAGGAKPVATPG